MVVNCREDVVVKVWVCGARGAAGWCDEMRDGRVAHVVLRRGEVEDWRRRRRGDWVWMVRVDEALCGWREDMVSCPSAKCVGSRLNVLNRWGAVM